MLNNGIPQVDIAEILGVSRSYVSQVRSKAVEDGYLSDKGKLSTKGIELVRGSNEG
jgi:predicted transcriptional regulator